MFVFWINKQIRPLFFVRPAQKETPHVSKRDMGLSVSKNFLTRCQTVKKGTKTSKRRTSAYIGYGRAAFAQ